MSTFVLKREYALAMPSSYVDIDRDEMEYVDGGAYYSKRDCQIVFGALAINPATYIGGAMSYTLATLFIKKVSAMFGGLAGWGVGLILSYAGSQIITFGTVLARGALNRGVDVSWNWNFFKDSIGISYSVR